MMKAVCEVNCEKVQLNPDELPNKNNGSVYFIEHIEGNENSLRNVIYKNEALTIILLNDTRVRVKLDTGTEANVIPYRVLSQLQKKTIIEGRPVTLKSYGGHDIPIMGKCTLDCHINNRNKLLVFYVVETTSQTIIGLESCQQLGLVKILNEVGKDTLLVGMDEKVKMIQGKRVKN